MPLGYKDQMSNSNGAPCHPPGGWGQEAAPREDRTQHSERGLVRCPFHLALGHARLRWTIRGCWPRSTKVPWVLLSLHDVTWGSESCTFVGHQTEILLEWTQPGAWQCPPQGTEGHSCWSCSQPCSIHRQQGICEPHTPSLKGATERSLDSQNGVHLFSVSAASACVDYAMPKSHWTEGLMCVSVICMGTEGHGWIFCLGSRLWVRRVRRDPGCPGAPDAQPRWHRVL